MVKKYLMGFLTLVILTSSLYLVLDEKVKFNIEKTRSKFYVWENDSWVLSGTEYVNLFDGTAKMRAKSRSIDWVIEPDFVTVYRMSWYKEGINVSETYTFTGTTDDVELFPLAHSITVSGGTGKILQYEVKDILYTGETRLATSPESFGHNMKLEWQDGAYYAKVFQYIVAPDKIIVKYRITEDTQTFNIRLFDPQGTNVNLTLNGEGNDRMYEFESVATLVTELTGGGTVCIDIDAPGEGVNVSCGTDITNYAYNISTIRLTEFDDNTTSKSLPSLGSYRFNVTALGNVSHFEEISYPLANESTAYIINSRFSPQLVSTISVIRDGTTYACTYNGITGTCVGTLSEIRYGDETYLSLTNTSVTVDIITSIRDHPQNTDFAYNLPERPVYEGLEGSSVNFSDIEEIRCTNTSGTYHYNFSVPGVANLSRLKTGDTCQIDLVSGINFSLYDYGYTLNFSIDNRSDIESVSLNVTSSSKTNLLKIDNKTLRGNLTGIYLEDEEFYFSGTKYIARNFTFTQKGSKSLYLNFSDNPFNVSFQLTGYDSQQGAVDFTEYYNNSGVDNLTITNLESIGEYDNFEYNVSGRWVESDTGTTKLTAKGLTTGKIDNYFYYNHSCFNCDTINVQYNIKNSGDTDFDLKNYSHVNIEKYTRLANEGGDLGATFSMQSNLLVTDGTNDIILKSYLTSGSCYSGSGIGTIFNNITLKRITFNSYQVYIDNNLESTKDLSTLDDTQKWKLKFSISTITQQDGVDYSCAPVNENYIYRIETSGLWTNKSQFGTEYATTGTVTSGIINTTSVDTNYSSIFITADHLLPDNITYELSANNGTTWKDATNFVNVQEMVFDTPGNILRYRINLSGTNESSPIVYQLNLNIISTSAENVTLNLGDDTVTDYILTGKLNSTTSPVIVSFNTSEIVKFNSSFTEMTLSSDTAGKVQIDQFFINSTTNPVILTASDYENCTTCNINFTFTGDNLTVSDLRVDYLGSINYTVTAHKPDYSDNATFDVQVKYSKFNLSFPTGVSWLDFFPLSGDDDEVKPYGQTSSIPIRNLTSQAYDEPMDVYIKTNATIDCVSTIVNNDPNFSLSSPVNVTTTYQKIATNVSTFGNEDLWMQVNLTGCTNRFEIPWFFYSSVCTDCYLNLTQLDYYTIIED